jgi:hypothetical protein
VIKATFPFNTPCSSRVTAAPGGRGC